MQHVPGWSFGNTPPYIPTAMLSAIECEDRPALIACLTDSNLFIKKPPHFASRAALNDSCVFEDERSDLRKELPARRAGERPLAFVAMQRKQHFPVTNSLAGERG